MPLVLFVMACIVAIVFAGACDRIERKLDRLLALHERLETESRDEEAT
jgi:hypothetical protein